MKSKNNSGEVSPTLRPFSGTLDELLNHVGNLNADKIDAEVAQGDVDVMLADEEAIQIIMKEAQCDCEEAVRLLQIVKEEELKDVLKGLIADGLVEAVTYDENGDPDVMKLTEVGNKFAEKLKKVD